MKRRLFLQTLGLTSAVVGCIPSARRIPAASVASETAEVDACPLDVAAPPDLASGPTEVMILQSQVFKDVTYRNLGDLLNSVAASGAFGVNAKWESGEVSAWHIEEQKRGADAVIGGLVAGQPNIIEAGFKMMEWGFQHQVADGSFQGTADDFHSTSIFVTSVAQAASYVLAAPGAEAYRSRMTALVPKLHAAARWMIGPIWPTGLNRNKPYTHRRYIVALGLALTSRLTDDVSLMGPARTMIQEGISLQACGVNPELDGHDTSYQAVGLWYASSLLANFPNDSFSKDLWRMLQRGFAWEASRIDRCGQIATIGNTRTGPLTTDTGPSGVRKDVDYNKVIRAMAYWQFLSQGVATPVAEIGTTPWTDRAFNVAWWRGWYQQGAAHSGCNSTYW